MYSRREEYQAEPVGCERHIKNIKNLSSTLSGRYKGILLDGTFRIGTAQKALNLYLKYCWARGIVKEPPHCPIDSIVLANVKKCASSDECRICREVTWTKISCASEYRHFVENAKAEAGRYGLSLARWELKLWNAYTAWGTRKDGPSWKAFRDRFMALGVIEGGDWRCGAVAARSGENRFSASVDFVDAICDSLGRSNLTDGSGDRKPGDGRRKTTMIRALFFALITISVLSAGQTMAEGRAMLLQNTSVTQSTFGIEAKDWGIQQTRELRIKQYHAPTPLSHSTARTITTQTLHQLLVSDKPTVLVDVLGGGEHETIPGAIWLKGAGTGKHLNDSIQKKFAAAIEAFTQGDKARPVIFFCLSAECWLSHNSALRATALGYANIHWYRGGIEAWQKAGLPTERSKRAK